MIRAVVFLIWICGSVLCQNRIGGSCVESYTNSIGVCIPAQHCQSAKIAYEKNGVRPTFCSYSFDEALVCCKDAGTYVPISSTPASPATSPSASPTASPAASPASSPASAATPPVLVKSEEETGDYVCMVGTLPAFPLDSENVRLFSPPIWSSDAGAETPVSGKRVSERKCDEYSRFSIPPPPDSIPNELIVGGVTTALNEFPHMAAIGWLNYEDTYSFNCGGSLISPSFVLTAGHCTSDPRARVRAPALVRLGDQNIDPDADDGANPEDIAIKSIIRHPSYAPPRRYDDIALLELETPAELSAAVHPTCLWTSEDIDHQTAVAIGWGVSDIKTKQRSKELQKVSLTLQETAYCERLLAVNRNRNWEGFARTQLCAGELRPGKDTCQGDSGAPLQVKTGDIYRIVGITSFGLNNCAESGRPAVYTRVSSYLPWIESVVWPGE